MYSRKHKIMPIFLGLAALVFGLVMALGAQAGDIDGKAAIKQPQWLEQTPATNITPAELADLFWPDSNATEVQREEALKNLLGKRVTWEIVKVRAITCLAGGASKSGPACFYLRPCLFIGLTDKTPPAR